MNEPRPWRRALVWLVFLGPFFFLSYGLANWLASRRAHVGSVVFAWERSIPFVPWTIIPYWSIDVLYAVSLFVCTTRDELDRHAKRLLVVQLISIVFFVALPLRFSFDRPEVRGVAGLLFKTLGSFDKPFNQAPSLHIGLLVVIWACLARHLTRRWRWVLDAWMILIAVSVLTTYQHHFIDVPTGLAVGFFAQWAIPDQGTSPIGDFVWTRDRSRRRLALIYAAASSACAALACLGGAALWLAWPAGALALVALNYAAFGERGFQKSPTGQLSIGARGLLAPYLIGARINSRRGPAPSEIVDGVSLGRVPTNADFCEFKAIVDMTAELSCIDPGDRYYRSIGVLDLIAPSDETLRSAARDIEDARRHGPVLVCCALGYSRSAAAVAAWLLLTRRASSVEEALAVIRKARPGIVLRPEHRAVLETLG